MNITETHPKPAGIAGASPVRPRPAPGAPRHPARGGAAGKQGVTDRSIPDRVVAVVERLTEAIVKGDFDGSRLLPSEGELAGSLGVSRTVVREALRSLRAQGLIEASKGRVARVKPPDSQATIASLRLLLRRNRTSLLQLIEVRRPLEGEIAQLAAERANAEHLRQLERAIHDLDPAAPLEDRVEADMRFHRVLVEATGNPVFVLLLETLAEFFHEFHHRTLDAAGVAYARAGHQAILTAVQDRDPARARDAMHQHLRIAADYLQRKNVRRPARLNPVR